MNDLTMSTPLLGEFNTFLKNLLLHVKKKHSIVGLDTDKPFIHRSQIIRHVLQDSTIEHEKVFSGYHNYECFISEELSKEIWGKISEACMSSGSSGNSKDRVDHNRNGNIRQA